MMVSSSLSAAVCRLSGTRRFCLVGAGLFLLGLGLRLLYVSRARAADPTFGNLQGLFDSLYYHRRASVLALGEVPQPALDYLSPLYTLALAAVYRVFGNEPLVAIGVQCVLGALSCVLLYAIGRRLFSEAAGIAAAVLLAAYGPHVYYGSLLLPEILVLVLHLVFLLALISPRGRPPSVPRWLFGGIVLGLAVGAKPNAILVLPAALLALLLQRDATPWRSCALAAGALALGLTLGLTPFALRNIEAVGEPALLGSTGGMNLWKGNGPLANGTHVFLPPGESQVLLQGQLFGQVTSEEILAASRDYTRRTIGYVMEEPGRTALLLVKKTALFFHAVELGIRDQFYFARSMAPVLWLAPFGFGLVAPLGLAGMWLARRRAEAALLYTVFAAQLLSIVAIFVLGRYRLVAVAMLMLFAGLALTTWARAWRERQWHALLPALAVALVSAVLIHLPWREFPPERGFASRYQEVATAYAVQERHREAIQAFEAAAQEAHREESPESHVGQARLGQAAAHLALGEVDRARVLIRPFLGAEVLGPLRRQALGLWARAAEIEAGH
jgi:4-amino-4-deoxy-L-arabinose transferase-like glycosyltransferase